MENLFNWVNVMKLDSELENKKVKNEVSGEPEIYINRIFKIFLMNMGKYLEKNFALAKFFSKYLSHIHQENFKYSVYTE